MGKKKPPEHRVGSEGERYLAFILGDWIVNPISEDDYGIDFSVIKLGEGGEQLQPEFDIQVKSSESYDGEQTVSERIDTGNLEDYMRSRKPVFLMVYDQTQQEIYWGLIQQYIWENYGRDPKSWQDQETVTIRLDRTPLADSRKTVYEVADAMEEDIHEYVREEAFMNLMADMVSRPEAQKTLEYRKSSSVELISEVHCRDISKISTGMANSGGGSILIGFEEEGYGHERKIIGVENPDQKIKSLRSSLEEVEPEIHADIHVEKVDGNPVIVAEISGYSELPHAYEGRFYIRRGTNTEILDPQELSGFFN